MRDDRRLTLLTHYFPGHRGGIEIVAHQLASRLSERWCIDWFAGSDAPSTPIGGLCFHSVPSWNGIERRFGLPFPLWAPSSLPRIWHSIGQADAVHIHDWLYPSNLIAVILAKLRGKPLLITQHIGAIPFDNALFRLLLEALNRTIGRRVLSSADQVVFVSPAVRQYFSAFCRFRRPALHIANGVDGGIFRPLDEAERNARRASLGCTEEDFVLLFVGRFVEKKGLGLLREMAIRRPGLHWLFAGHGVLDPAAWALPQVRVFRDRSGASLAELYQIADVLVLPSRGEGFPLVVQEAMACGTPVLVAPETAAGAPALAAQIEVEDVMAADAVQRWLNHIDRLSHESDALATRRTEIAKAARVHWSWEATTEEYGEILQRMATGSLP